MPPDVATLRPVDVAAGAAQDDRLLHGRRVRERLVRVPLEWDGLPAAQPLVLRDEQLALHVVQAARERVGGEPAEHNRVRRAEARAGEHRDRQLGNHPHVDADRRSLADAEALERICEADDLTLEVGERQRPALVGRLPLPVVGDLVAEARLDVPVDAVVRDVELAAEVPLRVRELPLEELVEGLEPGDALPPFRLPELAPVALVDVRLGVCLRGEVGWRAVTALFEEERLDRLVVGFFSRHGAHPNPRPPSRVPGTVEGWRADCYADRRDESRDSCDPRDSYAT